MSERFGIPDHAPQHAPDHAQQNPTPAGSWGTETSGADWPPTSQPIYGGGGGGGGLGVGLAVDPRKSTRFAIFLAMVLGPLGLFYVSFLNGVAALFIVVPIVRPLAFSVADALGGRIQVLTALIPLIWSVTIPWAVIGTRWRNRKIDRLAGR